MEIATVGNYAPTADAFAALADPTRLRILERLRGSDRIVSDLASELGVGMPSMSKHLNVLERAGFVTRHVEAQRRRCSLRPDGFHALTAWTAEFEALWSGRLERLDALLESEPRP